MTFAIYDATVPVLAPMLSNLAAWLNKAEAHANSQSDDSAKLLSLRLAPDMLPLTSQVTIACDIAKILVAKLADLPATPAPEVANTLAGLAERALEASAFLRSVAPAQFEGSEERAIVLPQRQGDPLHFSGATLLQDWGMPHVFFHVTTTYALLRHAGVDLGKADYLGQR
jgi:uncharacterized protein